MLSNREFVALFTSGDPVKVRLFNKEIKKLNFLDRESVWTELRSKGYKEASVALKEPKTKVIKKSEACDLASNAAQILSEVSNIPENPVVKIQKNGSQHSSVQKSRVVKIPKGAVKVSKESEIEYIVLNSAEQERLADIVWRMRKNEPLESVQILASKAMSQFPAERRHVNTNFNFLAEYLKKRDEVLLEKEADLIKLEQKIKQLKEPSLADVMKSADLELVGIIYNDLVSNAIKSSRSEPTPVSSPVVIPAGSNVTINVSPETTSSPAVPKKFKITIVGTKSDQNLKLKDKLSNKIEFTFIDKDRNNITFPSGQDAVLLWADFISHSIQDRVRKQLTKTGTKIIVHRGGLSNMIDRLEKQINTMR